MSGESRNAGGIAAPIATPARICLSTVGHDTESPLYKMGTLRTAIDTLRTEKKRA